MSRTVIIGAGAAGMMAGIFAASCGSNTVIIEKNSRPGRKLMITGKGRCNLTNDCDVRTVINNTPTGGRFLYSSLTAFSPDDTKEFFISHGLPLKTERGGRVFPVSDKASDVVDTLSKAVERSGCTIVNGSAVRLEIKDGNIRGVELSDGRKLAADSVIIACGGASYPLTGSTGDGYALAEQAGHKIIPLRPSLVPLETEEHCGYDSDGLLLKNISVKIIDNKKEKTVYTDFGELELKRWGLSGAVIRSASAHMKDMSPGRYSVEIDLKPALSSEKLDSRLVREQSAAGSGSFESMVRTLIPSGMIKDIISQSGISAGKKCAELTREERSSFCHLLKHWIFNVRSFRPLEEAIVTSGGVCTKEIDPGTMQSKLVKGLYFAGEVIDYDCYTGGFNIQAAFSTGAAAGRSAAAEK